MASIATIPIWLLAILIFALRVCDVSFGTLRTIFVVEGMTKLAVVLGFFEVFIWIVAVSQVISRIDESLLLALAYAGGFATGNAVGITLEKRFAFGSIVLRIVTRAGPKVAEALRATGQVLTTFDGAGRDGPVTLIYATLLRRKLPCVLRVAQDADPNLFFVVERTNHWGHAYRAIPRPTGWRAILKGK